MVHFTRKHPYEKNHEHKDRNRHEQLHDPLEKARRHIFLDVGDLVKLACCLLLVFQLALLDCIHYVFVLLELCLEFAGVLFHALDHSKHVLLNFLSITLIVSRFFVKVYWFGCILTAFLFLRLKIDQFYNRGVSKRVEFFLPLLSFTKNALFLSIFFLIFLSTQVILVSNHFSKLTLFFLVFLRFLISHFLKVLGCASLLFSLLFVVATQCCAFDCHICNCIRNIHCGFGCGLYGFCDRVFG